ncbi:MAG: hypothetical protein HC828_03830 [Blastochloris sp.]|nr:hypothetical protein [Blastochloris sp.]
MSMDTSTNRKIVQRLVITGTLSLKTPMHLGNGDSPQPNQMALFRDPLNRRVVLAGTSLAGALRDYLRTREHGHRTQEPEAQEADTRHLMAENLFGGRKQDPDGDQSPLIIDDVRSQQAAAIVRDGVAIDDTTRTAADQKKFDIELLPAGTTFDIRLELALPEDTDQQQQLKTALALALHGLAKGEIALGARTSRGLGRCEVGKWTVTTYDLTEPSGLVAWLASDYREWGYQPSRTVIGDAWTVLGVTDGALPDNRHTLQLCAYFTLASPLLVGGDGPLSGAVSQPDATHIHGDAGPIVPGSSLAGALRSRAVRIVNTLGLADGAKLIEQLFGSSMQQNGEHGNRATQRSQKQRSRLRVTESQLTDTRSLVQHRVAIDRFTGGAFETALFSEAPVTAGTLKLEIQLDDPVDHEIGLLLFLLKDLWTGDLRLGGTQSIGRGRLCGQKAELVVQKPAGEKSWTMTQTEDGLTITGDQQAALEEYGQALYKQRGTAQEETR